MFDTGNILFCKDFQFNNNNPDKDKYFIVLKRTDNNILLGSLPTSKNKIPAFITIPHGCINLDDRCYNCYLFEAGRSICDNNFCFPRHTYTFGDQLDTYETNVIEKNYSLGVTYRVEGKLTENEFSSLIDCFLNSNSVKNKHKRILKGK